MEIEKLIESLKKQNLPKGEYAVFGSAVMAIKGLRVAPNIDVIVTNKLWELLLSKRHKPDEEGFIRIGQIKISNWWFAPTRKDIPVMIKEAEIISGIPFVQLAEVRDYKKFVNRDKDINDVKLIDKYLEVGEKLSEPIGLGIKDYQKFLDIFVSQVNKYLGDKVLSLILFGSASRGQAKGNSDLDVFVFFDDKKINKDDINTKFIQIIYDLRQSKEYKNLVVKNIYPEIYPFLISKSKANDSLWVFFDACEEGVVLKDTNNFGILLIKNTKKKIKELGGRKTQLPSGKHCWILFKNFAQIQQGALNI